MITEKSLIAADIQILSNKLTTQYESQFNFRNHCYLRIAYDNTIGDKWDIAVRKPFVKYATVAQLIHALKLLNIYTKNKADLLLDNEKSLQFRQKHILTKVNSKTLFD